MEVRYQLILYISKALLKLVSDIMINTQLYLFLRPLCFFFLQDSPDPLNNSFLQPQCPGILALELDWLPLRTNKNDPLMLCIAGADSSFRLVEVNV